MTNTLRTYCSVPCEFLNVYKKALYDITRKWILILLMSEDLH